MNDADSDLLLAASSEVAERDSVVSAGLISRDGSAHLRRRTLREILADGFRRAWYGPGPEPLANGDMRMILLPREDEDDLPERVPPDDPERLAWEAELRAKGYTPAKVWNWPERKRIPRATLWERLRYRLGGD